MQTAQIWKRINGLKSCLVASLLAITAPALGQDSSSAQVDWYVNQLHSTIAGFKEVYCPAQPDVLRRVCRDTPFLVSRSLEINAYAQRRGGQDVVVINVGLAAVLDQIEQARIASMYLTSDSRCFSEWMGEVVRDVGENSQRVRVGLKARPVPTFGYFGQTNDNCRGISPATVNDVVSRNGVNYAKGVESALVMIFLHELGHVAAGHTAMPNEALTASQDNETEADDFIAKAAARAGQPIIFNITPIYLMATQGNSLDWERRSDHPLGVRRVLRIYQQFKYQLQTSTALRQKLSPQAIDGGIRYLDTRIRLLSACMSQINAHEQCR